MSGHWLTIVGIGDDGLDGLSPLARSELEGAEAVFGGKRHLSFFGTTKFEKYTWQSPLQESLKSLDNFRGRPTVVLATGNPIWYGIGRTILNRYGRNEINIISSPSSFTLAAIRMGWALESSICLSVHGRPVDDIRKYFFPGARILLLTNNASTPSLVAKLLCEEGYGGSRITAFAHMGGKKETKETGRAANWTRRVPKLHTLAMELNADNKTPLRPFIPGLPDSVFENDGNMTKREIRSITLAKLAPIPEQHLWDVGAGCGSVGIEWMRVAKNARTTAIEPRKSRRRFIKINAIKLGVSTLNIVADSAPECIEGLELPDAIFIGGGLTEPHMIDRCIEQLKVGGRIVANSVTLESENVLLNAFAEFGGDLVRLSVSQSVPVGRFTGWRPAMPVTQWSFTKR